MKIRIIGRGARMRFRLKTYGRVNAPAKSPLGGEHRKEAAG